MTSSPTKNFYDRISHVYDLIADGGEHAARQRGLKLLDVQEGERVLEIGFGTGRSLRQIAEKVGSSELVHGIDISTGMEQVASKYLREHDLDGRVELTVGSVPPLPYENGSFDAVAISFTLELFPDDVIPQVLADSIRVLRPEGRIGIVSMAQVADGERESTAEKTYKWMHTHFPHIVDCRPIPLRHWVEQAGFIVDQNERIELFGMPVGIIVAHRK
jgi:demethylmenaquinone methyltransferase/2-methoxy-6-polyprenyl-1,4-benzoquinol methylase